MSEPICPILPIGNRKSSAPPAIGVGNTYMPTVSIVTPSYNQGRFIRETIESVLTQDYPNIDYWVIDGGSTDNTINILREYECDRRFQWLSEKDQGQSDAINKGLSRCSGDLFAWLNSDDLFLPGALYQVASTWVASRPAIMYGRAKFIDQHGVDLGYCPMHSSTMTLKKLLSGKYSPIQPATFVPTAHARQIGGVDTSLHFSMDFDFLIRLAETLPIIYVSYDLALYRLHQTSKTVASASKFVNDIEQVYQKAVQRGTLTERQGKVLMNLLSARKYLMPEVGDTRSALARLAGAVRDDYSVLPEVILILLKAAARFVMGDRLWSKIRLAQIKLG